MGSGMGHTHHSDRPGCITADRYPATLRTERRSSSERVRAVKSPAVLSHTMHTSALKPVLLKPKTIRYVFVVVCVNRTSLYTVNQ